MMSAVASQMECVPGLLATAVPGCPPTPIAMLQGLLALLEQADARVATS